MELLNQFVVITIVAICLSVGFIIKNSLDFIPNKYIPLIMGVLGVLISVWLNVGVFTPMILLEGLASGLAATGAFELVKGVTGDSKKDVK